MQKVKNLFHLFEAIIANIYYGFPSRKLKVIGVTGTDGKTTTTSLIYHILKSSGKKVSMISTVYAKVGSREFDTGLHTTTPSSFMVQKFLALAVKNNDEYFVLETTSHALDQNRVFGVKYYIGVLTNVTHEHLDYHTTYENYLKTKTELLSSAETAVINKDDKSFKEVKRILDGKKIYTYDHTHYDVLKHCNDLPEFNKANYLAAYTVCKILGIDKNEILNYLSCFKLPAGRLEIVYDKNFKVIIDFAHTPNAIENVLREIRRIYLKKGGRLIHVFGSAGLRDATKRPAMGAASDKYADFSIITEEDCRTENSRDIADQITSGFKTKKYIYELDRKKAIEKAVSMAQKNDLIVCTGKSHEQSLCRGKTEFPWDEKKAIMETIYDRSR